MARRWWLMLIGLAAIPLVVWGFDRVKTMYWVGGTDLEVEFCITDAATGRPIKGAKVAVHSEGGFYEDREEKDFTLVSGDDGIARQVCRNSMCFGTRSGLGFTNTFVVHLPWWHFRVLAPGYASSELVHLDDWEHVRQAQRVGPGAAKLVVNVSLQESRAP